MPNNKQTQGQKFKDKETGAFIHRYRHRMLGVKVINIFLCLQYGECKVEYKIMCHAKLTHLIETTIKQ